MPGRDAYAGFNLIVGDVNTAGDFTCYYFSTAKSCVTLLYYLFMHLRKTFKNLYLLRKVITTTGSENNNPRYVI